MHSHLGRQTGGRVDLDGKNPVRRRHSQPAIPFTFDRRAMRLDRMDNLTEQLCGRGPYNNSGARWLLTRLADLHVLKIECAAHHQNRVQHLRQDQRIDDMALEKNSFLVLHHKSDSHPGSYAQILPPVSTDADQTLTVTRRITER